jgi:hypothetical protein
LCFGLVPNVEQLDERSDLAGSDGIGLAQSLQLAELALQREHWAVAPGIL